MAYTFRNVTVAGAAGGTKLGAINNAGEVVGYYVPDAPGGRSIQPQAFTDTNGAISVLAGFPLSTQTTGNGINNAGQVVGAVGSSPVTQNGYVYSPNGTEQRITSQPSAPFGVIDKAYGINDLGQVVGTDLFNRHVAFVSQGGSMSFFQAPGAVATEARGINNAGEMVGFYSTTAPQLQYVGLFSTAAPEHGFADINGQFSTIDVPGAVATDPAAVNLAGVIAGSYFDGAHWHGFVDTAGQMQFINAPGAADTWVTGINDLGDLSGYFDTATTPQAVGFIATDAPSPVAAAPAHVGASSLLQQHAMFGIPHHMMHSRQILHLD